MSNKVGDIFLELQVDDKTFQAKIKKMSGNGAKQLESSFGASFGKIGKMAAAAFSVKTITDFVGSCLNLGSDLMEVQNVVDTAFPNMSAQANDFAKNAMESFGLSETVAKKYLGTFGAMASAFGFSEKEAYDMSEALTGLAGDVASFYNLSSDEAYTKLKSVFTGETESLKDLGVVMTQTSLDQYALANGFGKTTSAMSEQEKVALRMAFVTDQLSMASGDFIKTQDSWANQTRILQLRFESLKASLGKGFIAIFTPIIKGINWVLSKLQVLADSFASLMEFLTGTSSNSQGNNNAISNVSKDLNNASDSSNDLGKNLTSAGEKGEKAAKKIQKAFAKVDTINKLSFGNDKDSDKKPNNDNNSTSSNVSEAVAFPKATEEASVFEKMLSGIVDEFKRLSGLFMNGFKIGFGDSMENINTIKGHIESLGKSLKEIFTSQEVIGAASNWVEKTVESLGKVTGSIASIGMTIATLLVGSVSQYISDNADSIKECIVDWFDFKAKKAEIIGNFSVALADIASVFSNPTAINIGSNLIGIIINGAMGQFRLLERLGTDILDCITGPIIDNKDKIKTAIQNTLKPIETVVTTLKNYIDKTVKTIIKLYDEHIHPFLMNIKDGVSDLVGTVLDGYNKYVAPVLKKLSEKFKEVFEDHVQPMIDKFAEAIGSIFDVLNKLWTKILQPLCKWILENIMPIIADVVEAVGETFLSAIENVSDFLGGVFDVIKNIVDIVGDFIDGIGDIVDVVKGIPEKVSMTITAIKDKAFDLAKGAWDAIKDSKAAKTLNALKEKAFDTVRGAWDAIKNGKVSKTLKAVKDKLFSSVKNSWDAIKNSTAVKTMKSKVANALKTAKNTWDSLKSKTISLGMKLSAAVANMKGFINNIIKAINKNVIAKLYLKIPGGIPFIGGYKIGPPPNIPKLAQGGYVRANQPQLAMIGDNRHYGEIVAPENKMIDMIDTALKMQKDQGNIQGLDTVILLIKELIELVKNLTIKVDIDVKRLSILLENAKKERQMIGG